MDPIKPIKGPVETDRSGDDHCKQDSIYKSIVREDIKSQPETDTASSFKDILAKAIENEKQKTR